MRFLSPGWDGRARRTRASRSGSARESASARFECLVRPRTPGRLVSRTLRNVTGVERRISGNLDSAEPIIPGASSAWRDLGTRIENLQVRQLDSVPATIQIRALVENDTHLNGLTNLAVEVVLMWLGRPCALLLKRFPARELLQKQFFKLRESFAVAAQPLAPQSVIIRFAHARGELSLLAL
jgi:hypothetical protein